MNSSEAIASALAPFISLRRTPETIDKLFELMDTITPEDVRDMAAKYFRGRTSHHRHACHRKQEAREERSTKEGRTDATHNLSPSFSLSLIFAHADRHPRRCLCAARKAMQSTKIATVLAAEPLAAHYVSDSVS